MPQSLGDIWFFTAQTFLYLHTQLFSYRNLIAHFSHYRWYSAEIPWLTSPRIWFVVAMEIMYHQLSHPSTPPPMCPTMRLFTDQMEQMSNVCGSPPLTAGHSLEALLRDMAFRCAENQTW